MSNNYKEYVSEIPLTWLTQGPTGSKYWQQIATIMDNNTDLAKEAVLASFPEYAPDDALQYLGKEFGILQGVDETNDDFKYRMRRYWNAWKFTGTALGVLTQLWFQGYHDAYCIQQNGLVFHLISEPDISNGGDLPASLAYFDAGTDPISGFPTFYLDGNDIASKFAILLTPIPGSWDDIVVPPTTTSSPSISELNVIINSIIQWKPAKATFIGLYIFAATTWTIGWPPRHISAPPGNPNAINYHSGTVYFIPPILY